MFVALSFILLLNSCSKEGVYSVRIKNDYSKEIYVQITDVFWPSISSGVTSDYRTMGYHGTGTFKVAVGNIDGQNLDGSITLEGKGENKWTVRITPSFGIDITKD